MRPELISSVSQVLSQPIKNDRERKIEIRLFSLVKQYALIYFIKAKRAHIFGPIFGIIEFRFCISYERNGSIPLYTSVHYLRNLSSYASSFTTSCAIFYAKSRSNLRQIYIHIHTYIYTYIYISRLMKSI